MHCTKDFEVCQLITGESEINAATTVSTVAFSSLFDLTHTYFFIAGIAGVNPQRATLGSATFARYAVQVALQYEIDIRELNSSYSTGYIPLGSEYPDQYPSSIYGTEVFEVNDDLRKLAVKFGRRATMSDSTEAKAYRANYETTSGEYKAATLVPSVVECDVATSDVYYAGSLLSDAFANTTKLFTNGTGDYCSTAQEDNATLEVLLRSSLHKLTDFSRIIVMRTASDFDRPYPGTTPVYNLMEASTGGFAISIDNIYNVGIEVVKGILEGWHTTFKAGVKPSNYIGDIFGTLGGEPDFGPGATEAYDDSGAFKKRSFTNKLKRRNWWHTDSSDPWDVTVTTFCNEL